MDSRRINEWAAGGSDLVVEWLGAARFNRPMLLLASPSSSLVAVEKWASSSGDLLQSRFVHGRAQLVQVQGPDFLCSPNGCQRGAPSMLQWASNSAVVCAS